MPTDELSRGCRFDPESHTYWIDEQRVPGMHEVLEAGGLCDTQWYTAEGKIKGGEVHRLCLDADLDALEEDFDSPYRGYVRGYQLLFPELQVEWTELEQVRYSRRLMAATRIDRIGIFKPGSPFAGRICIADLKSGGKEDWHGIQLAGGELIRGYDEELVRLSIYLKPKGRPQVYVHKLSTDRDKYLRALEAYWKGNKHGDSNTRPQTTGRS